MRMQFSAPMWLACLALCLSAHPAHASPPTPQGDAQWWDGYFQGIMRLREGKWPQAVDAFTQISKIARGDGRTMLARGVAYTLMQEYEKARLDLQSARIPNSREPQLWLHAVDAMSDDLRIGGDIGNNQRRDKNGRPIWFMGVPGHAVQGGKDYPTNYASYVIYDMAMAYRDSLEKEKPLDAQAFNAIKLKAGRWFANRALASNELSSRSFAHAQKLMATGELREARDLLDLARSPYYFDADMSVASGDLWLRVGRPATARKDYTIGLMINTALGTGYAGRAQAAAMMGDANRARADLKTAQSLNAAPADLSARIESLLKTHTATGDPIDLLAKLDQAAISGASVDALIPLATQLQTVMAARRLRYDEVYQEKLREMELAIKNDQANFDLKLDLAQYLIDESDNRGENVEPRRGIVQYRWRQSKGMEINRAIYWADQAIRMDANNPRALVTKAFALAELDQDDAANRLLDQAMRTSGANDPKAVRLLAKFRSRQIGRMFAAASALRTPTTTSSTHTENRSDGVWEVTTTRTYQPTASDLARADAFERQARFLLAQTRQIMETAVRLSRGTLEGLLLESSFENWFGTRDKALALLREAVKKYPKELAGHDGLVQYLRFMGRRDESLEAEIVALSLVQTTCGPLLRKVWDLMPQQGWGPMENTLNRARSIDPTDVRATLYLAAMEANLDDKPKGAALYRVAAALETARLSLDETGDGKSWPRRADDMAALMSAHNILARASKLFGKPDQELWHYQQGAALAQRFPPDGLSALMFDAMMPNDKANQVPLPAPDNGSKLAGELYLGAARSLKAMNRGADAAKYFELAANLAKPGNPNAPNIGNANGDTNFSGNAGQPAAEALVELAKADIANGKYKEAMEKLQAATQSNPPREMRREINEMIIKMLPHLNER